MRHFLGNGECNASHSLLDYTSEFHVSIIHVLLLLEFRGVLLMVWIQNCANADHRMCLVLLDYYVQKVLLLERDN